MSLFNGAPEVRINEIDKSLYIASTSTTTLGLVGLATKGPINVPTLITTPQQFVDTFGDYNTSFFAPYAAQQYLRNGRQLKFVRVAEPDPLSAGGSDYLAKYAKLVLSENTTPATITGTVNSLVTLTSSNKVLHFIIDGSGPGFDVTFSGVPAGGVTKSMTDIVGALNADAGFSAYLFASLSSTGTLVIRRATNGTLLNGASHSFQISGSAVSASNIFGFPGVSGGKTSTIYGTGVSTEQASVIGSDTAGSYTIATGTNDQLSFYMGDGTLAPTLTTFTVPAGTYATPTDLVTALNAISGFNTDLVASVFGAVGGTGGQIKVSLKSTSAKTHLALGVAATHDCGVDVFGNINGQKQVVGNVDLTAGVAVVTGANDTLVFTLETFGSANATVTVVLPAATYTHTSLASALAADAGFAAVMTASTVTVGGLHYSKVVPSGAQTGLILSGGNARNSLYGDQPMQVRDTTTSADSLDIQATTQGTWGNNLSVTIVTNTDGSFNLNVYEKNVLVESWPNLVKSPVLVPDPVNPGLYIPNTKYVETAINGNSPRITVTNPVVNSVLSTTTPSATGTGVKPYLTGGSDGAPPTNVVDPSIYIGYISSVGTTGLQFFRNPEAQDINLLAVPGISDATVINEMIDICSTRRDCMCLVDPPFGYSVQQVVDWVNGAGAFSGDHAAFNSSYAALYYPWQQIFDATNNVKVFVPPSGLMANVYAFTDLVGDPWNAPAGLTRGHLTSVEKAERILSKGEMDLLYQNNINPIATFLTDGINVWGQKTLQRLTTALDRVNVRRMCLFVERSVVAASRGLLFEPDDEKTWLQMKHLVEPLLQTIKDRRGLRDFKVQCDETTNTDAVVEQNQMVCNIYLKPTKTVEFILINAIITSQNSTFDELVVAN